jgi:hypothetical protein
MQFVTGHIYPIIKLKFLPNSLKNMGFAFVVITTLMGQEKLMFRSSAPDYYYL